MSQSIYIYIYTYHLCREDSIGFDPSEQEREEVNPIAYERVSEFQSIECFGERPEKPGGPESSPRPHLEE